MVVRSASGTRPGVNTAPGHGYRKGTGTQMHNPQLLVSRMVAREHEHARLNRHAWKRPPEPKPQPLVRRAIAAARRLWTDE
jgi:hypothetical protein